MKTSMYAVLGCFAIVFSHVYWLQVLSVRDTDDADEEKDEDALRAVKKEQEQASKEDLASGGELDKVDKVEQAESQTQAIEAAEEVSDEEFKHRSKAKSHLEVKALEVEKLAMNRSKPGAKDSTALWNPECAKPYEGGCLQGKQQGGTGVNVAAECWAQVPPVCKPLLFSESYVITSKCQSTYKASFKLITVTGKDKNTAKARERPFVMGKGTGPFVGGYVRCYKQCVTQNTKMAAMYCNPGWNGATGTGQKCKTEVPWETHPDNLDRKKQFIRQLDPGTLQRQLGVAEEWWSTIDLAGDGDKQAAYVWFSSCQHAAWFYKQVPHCEMKACNDVSAVWTDTAVGGGMSAGPATNWVDSDGNPVYDVCAVDGVTC